MKAMELFLSLSLQTLCLPSQKNNVEISVAGKIWVIIMV
jgi:hypothetical protein